MKKGVLLVNLGTPSDASKKAVKRYLKAFLSDRRVIDLPWLVRKVVLYFFILPFRVSRSTNAYKAIWKETGAPLLFHTQELAEGLRHYLGRDYEVEVGMRYGTPDLINALETLLARCEKVIIFPLFPQYASATTGSIIEKVVSTLQHRTNIPALTIVSDFYDHADYIKAKASIIAPLWEQFKPDKLFFSYHSLPWRQLYKSSTQCVFSCFKDKPCPLINEENRFCYRAQCYETSRLLAQQLGGVHFEVVFQSRLGRTLWCGPELERRMVKAREEGVKKLLIACPSFVTDCLETLEEIGIRATARWQALGGEVLKLVPCLNADPNWIQVLGKMILSYTCSNAVSADCVGSSD